MDFPWDAKDEKEMGVQGVLRRAFSAEESQSSPSTDNSTTQGIYIGDPPPTLFLFNELMDKCW